MNKNKKMEIALGPAPFNWGRSRLMDFYCGDVADTGVTSIYIGNTNCHKRNILNRNDFQTIIETLHQRGIKVYFSTLALCTTPEEFDYVKDLYELFDGIEINMLGYLNLLKQSKYNKLEKEIVLGPFLNIYNWKSASYLKKFNPKKQVAPFELPLDSIEDVVMKSDIPMEVTVWGNLSTALSWRCYSARAIDRSREDCGKVCFEHPEGMLLKSVENEELFIIDGLQVLSAKTHCLLKQLPQLEEKGISTIRIYPQLKNTVEIIGIFNEGLAGQQDIASLATQLKEYAPCGFCNGWLWGKAGWEYVAA